MTEQLDVFEELDAANGFDGWVETLPCPPWPVTTEELARRCGHNVELMDRVLCEEEKRGNVERDGNGWRISKAFLQDYGRAFAHLSLEVEEAA